jgi:hypothetical protein
MKSKRFWFRALMIVILSGVALAGLIAASPTLISDWIFRTGQHTFTVYNSSTQAIESVDNRNKGRKQYGALSVDGALYANSTINATGDINIGADVSLSRSAADVLTTADSIVSATHTVTGGDLLLGSTGSLQRFMVLDPYGSRGLNVAHLRFNTSSGNTIKLNTPLDSGAYYMTSFEVNTLNSANQYGRANVSIYWNYGSSQFTAGYNTVQTSGFFPYRTVTFGIENGKIAIAFSNPSANLRDIRVDLQSTNYSNATATAHLGKYLLSEDTNISDWTNTAVLTSIANLASVSPNGLMIGTNTTSLTSGYVLDVSGAAYVSGTIYGAGNISGLTFTDRTPGSPEDALSEIGMWKVTGDQVDHDSLGECAVDIKEVKTGFEIKDKSGNVFNSIEEKVVPAKGSNDAKINALSEAATKLEEGIAEVSAEYQVKEVTKIVETKGRDISKTVSTLSRAIQQLSERLDKLEGR